MRLNSKLVMNMTENTHLYKHVIMYKLLYINMLTQKVELAVAKTHQNISSPNLRPFSDSEIGRRPLTHNHDVKLLEKGSFATSMLVTVYVTTCKVWQL